MDINKLTIGEVREIASLVGGTKATKRACPFRVGDAYLIRTVTNYWTGRVEQVVGGFIVLSSAAWIADTGRYSEAVDEEHLKEIEPAGDGVFVALGSIIDARPWATPLPAKVK